MLYENVANFLCNYDVISSLKLFFMAFEHSVITMWVLIMPWEVCYILMRNLILNSYIYILCVYYVIFIQDIYTDQFGWISLLYLSLTLYCYLKIRLALLVELKRDISANYCTYTNIDVDRFNVLLFLMFIK